MIGMENFVAIARRLRSAGCPLEISEDGLESGPMGLRVVQIDNPPENSILDLDPGGAYYVLHIAVCNDLDRPMRIEQFWLEPPWEDPDFHWLEDPYKSAPRRTFYFVPGSGLYLDRQDVLNHRIGRNGRVLPHDSIEGLLLAVGLRPIPEHYPHAFKLQTTLCVVDGRGKRYRSKVWLWGYRSLKLVRRQAEAKSRQRPRLREAMSPDSDHGRFDVLSETATRTVDPAIVGAQLQETAPNVRRCCLPNLRIDRNGKHHLRTGRRKA